MVHLCSLSLEENPFWDYDYFYLGKSPDLWISTFMTFPPRDIGVVAHEIFIFPLTVAGPSLIFTGFLFNPNTGT
jgi:hypothetical protein